MYNMFIHMRDSLCPSLKLYIASGNKLIIQSSSLDVIKSSNEGLLPEVVFLSSSYGY